MKKKILEWVETLAFIAGMGWLLYLVVIGAGCNKEETDLLLGAWKKAAPFAHEKGFSFYTDGRLYRYFDKCLPLDSLDKSYTYTHRGDSVFITGPQGQTAWALEWISRDFIRVREPQNEHLTNVFFLERDYWGR